MRFAGQSNGEAAAGQGRTPEMYLGFSESLTDYSGAYNQAETTHAWQRAATKLLRE